MPRSTSSKPNTAGNKLPYHTHDTSQRGKDAHNLHKHEQAMAEINRMHDRVHGETRSDTGKNSGQY